MNRTIKFRGKRLDNGEWVYGFPQYNEWMDEWYIFPPQGMTGTTGQKVDPDTLGQFTGLKDRNGTEIYEGDILDSTYYEDGAKANIPCTVIWDDDGWSCFTEDDNCLLSTAVSYGAEVKGNIHKPN